MIMKTPAVQRGAFGGGALAAGLAGLAFFTLSATPSAAQYDYRVSFAALDADGDGVITPEEYEGGGSHSTVAVDLRRPGGVAPAPAGAASSGAAPGAGNDPEIVTFALSGSPPAGAQPTLHFAFMMDIDFGQADIDGDGAVDFDEFVARHEQLLAHEFANHDADGDGRLTPAEFLGAPTPAPGIPQELFTSLDRDGDGAITLAEFQAGPD